MRERFVVRVDDNLCTPTIRQIELALQLLRGEEPRLFPGDGAPIIYAIIEQHFCE